MTATEVGPEELGYSDEVAPASNLRSGLTEDIGVHSLVMSSLVI